MKGAPALPSRPAEGADVRGIAVVGLAALILMALWLAGYGAGDGVLGFPLDDAWIHMVYGRGLAADGVFTYNPGTPSTGATSLLWACVLGALHLLFGVFSVGTIVVATFVVNGLLFLITVWGAINLARAIGAQPQAAYAAGICVGTAPLFAVSVYSGMEVMLCAVLLVLGLTSLVRANWGRAGLYLGLACTARPEAALPLCFAALIVLARLYRQRGPGDDRVARALPPLIAFAAAPALLGASAIGYYLWASGRALPATYYVKQSLSLAELPERLWIAVAEMLVLVAPFASGLAWVGLVGLLLSFVGRKPTVERSPHPTALPLLPLAAGALFIVGNVSLINPTDPQAFYHQRYILPAVPLLIVPLVHGFERIPFGRNPRLRQLPLWGFVVFCLLLVMASVARTSRDHHSDTRNINALQRGLGLWLADHTSADAWVASNDAGAVRYFSGRPVVDIMGLNTPELLWNAPDYARSHPVEAVVFMPAWFSPTSADGFETLARITTTPYTVTSYPTMATQVALGCPGAGAAVPLRLVGAADVVLYCKPGAGRASGPAR